MHAIELKDIGIRIRSQREFLGYTREELAEKLGITPKFCSDIELGVKGMSLQTLINISLTLKMTTDYILFGSTSSSNQSDRLIHMLNTCTPEKLKYAESILKSFILALD